MNFLRLLPVILSAVLLGAHFLRAGQSVLAILIVLFPALLILRRPWVARLTQLVLLAGGVEWLRTLLVFVSARRESGQPWTRLAVILGAVALITVSSGLFISFSTGLRKRYRLDESP